MTSAQRSIKSFSIDELHATFEGIKLPRFRALQVLSWLYCKHARSYDEMTNLPKSLREQLDASFPLRNPRVSDKQESADGTRKYLLEFHDGSLAETVGIPSGSGRLTVCASTQSGCGMGCVFCATGKNGFSRDLLAGEIVDQVLVVQDDFESRVTNGVLMGQGEPFANYDATLAALRIMKHPKLMNLGARHLTVSTCGILEGIERLSE